MGLSNGFGSVAGIFVPMVKEMLVGSPTTCEDLIHRFMISVVRLKMFLTITV